MILPNMTKKEILKETRPVFPRQDEVIRKAVSSRTINLARISFRRKRKPVYAGTRKMEYQGTTYFAVAHLTFPYGTKATSHFPALIQTYAISRSINGKPLLIYIVPTGDNEEEYYENSMVAIYSHHFLSRFWERTRGYVPPESKTFEELAQYFFENSGLNKVQQIIEDIGYKDFPPPLCIARTDKGLELGSYNTEQGIFYFNTFVSNDMFHSQQEENYGEESEIFKFLQDSNVFLTEQGETSSTIRSIVDEGKVQKDNNWIMF